MVEKKKGKKRKEDYVGLGEDAAEKPTKDEYSIAKWMRKNVPIKKTKFLNHIVEYFTASRAIDALLESKYAQGDDALFTTRSEVEQYLQVMLEHKFFHRAQKIPVAEHELKGGKKKDKKPGESAETTEKKPEEKKEKVTDAESSVVEGKVDAPQEKEKRKRKIRLDMHNNQVFVDGVDAYVWIYDPIPFHYWIFGALLVLAAIGICLFPLWPPSVRLGVYYLSVAAAGFLVFMILCVVLRLIIFCLVWVCSAGKHHLWILPNLTEDVGLLVSFWPLYKYEYKGNSNKKKKKKDKDSDAEEEKDDDKQESSVAPETPDQKRSKGGVLASEDAAEDEGDSTAATATVEPENHGPSESESESSQRSSTDRDFEMVDKDDLDS